MIFKKPKTYRITYIDKTHSNFDPNFNSMSFGEARLHCLAAMKEDKSILSVVIFSDQGTCTVLYRRNFKLLPK